MSGVSKPPQQLPAEEPEEEPEFEEDDGSPGIADLFVERIGSLSYPKVLFAIYVAVGLFIFTFVVPPFQKPDEPAHYQRSVSVTNLDFTCGEDATGKSAFFMKQRYGGLPVIMHTWDVYLVYNNKFDPDWFGADFSDPALNETVPVYDICNLPAPGYIPNALGILMGKPFENPLIGFYLGRVLGAVFFVICFVAAVRITPERFKMPLYLYGALPVVLHQVSAINYDAVHLAIFPLIYAYLTRFVVDNTTIRKRDLIIFTLLLLWAIQVRGISYAPLALLFFAIRPVNIAGNARKYLVAAGAFVVIAVASTAASSLIYLPNVQSAPLDGSEGIRPAEQGEFVLNNPLKFIEASYNTIHHQGDWLIKQSIGIFGWLDTPLNWYPMYFFVAIAGAVFFFLIDRDQKLMNPLQIVAVLGAVLFTSIALFFSLYAVWSNVGANEVLGLQGRYFVGLMPFTMLGFSQLAGYIGKRFAFNLALTVFALLLLYQMYRAIDLRFYL